MKKAQWMTVLLIGVISLGVFAGMLGCHKDSAKTPTIPGTPINTGKNQNEEKQLVLSDTLTNGATKATLIGGGVFTPEGYYFDGSQEGYIIYDTTISGNFRVEFDTKGLRPDEWYHAPDDQSTLLIMQDAPLGTNWVDWDSLPYCLFQMIKLTWYPGSGEANGMKVKAGCDGGATGFELASYLGGMFVGPHPLDWDPNTTYHWVVTVKDGHVEMFRNDEMMMYGDGFLPRDSMRFFFGGTGAVIGRLTPDNATFSNIKIYQQ